jgi:hypothetical protein
LALVVRFDVKLFLENVMKKWFKCILLVSILIGFLGSPVIPYAQNGDRPQSDLLDWKLDFSVLDCYNVSEHKSTGLLFICVPKSVSIKDKDDYLKYDHYACYDARDKHDYNKLATIYNEYEAGTDVKLNKLAFTCVPTHKEDRKDKPDDHRDKPKDKPDLADNIKDKPKDDHRDKPKDDHRDKPKDDHRDKPKDKPDLADNIKDKVDKIIDKINDKLDDAFKPEVIKHTN